MNIFDNEKADELAKSGTSRRTRGRDNIIFDKNDQYTKSITKSTKRVTNALNTTMKRDSKI